MRTQARVEVIGGAGSQLGPLGLLSRERVAEGAALNIEILGQRRSATIHTTPLVDADGARMRR